MSAPGSEAPSPLLVRTAVLPPEAASAGDARRLLLDALRDAGRERWADNGTLAITELVTNAVLHTGTTVEVTIAVGPDEVDVRVHDDSPVLPLPRAYGPQATTGRGLRLVTALTSDCGVHPRDDVGGKEVWFRIRDDAQVVEPTVDDLLAAWDLDDVSAFAAWDSDEGRAALESPVARPVALRAMPALLWLATRQHHDGLLRELTLYVAEHDDVTVDLGLADRARLLITRTLLAELERLGVDPLAPDIAVLQEQLGQGVDLELAVPDDLGLAYEALQDALDAAERLAAEGRLLVRPGLPEIVAVRDWACEQVIAQLAGAPPLPWPGTAQERFEFAVDGRALDWDDTLVRESDRPVVAADDTNRIVAVSRPLAELVGWQVEDLLGRRVVTLIPPQLREAHVAGFSRYLSTGEARVLGRALDLPVLHADGRQLRCRYLVEEAPAQAGRTVYLAWIDPLPDAGV